MSQLFCIFDFLIDNDKMRYTDILFDLDDTLIDTATNTRLTVAEVYDDYRFADYFDCFEDFFSIYHLNVSRLWSQYNSGDISKEELQKERFASTLRIRTHFTEKQIESINSDYVERVMAKDTLIDGAMDLLHYLHADYRLHILSNGFTEMQYKKMESARIPVSYFDTVILSDVVGVNKPHPDIFKYTLKKIKTNVDRIIMIGDNLKTDIIGAQTMGIDQIWFNPEAKSAESVKPTYQVSHLLDIKSIL